MREDTIDAAGTASKELIERINKKIREPGHSIELFKHITNLHENGESIIIEKFKEKKENE